MTAPGEMRFPYINQRRMLTIAFGICVFAFVVSGTFRIFNIQGYQDGWYWFGIAAAILAIPRFTYYRKEKKERGLK